MFRGQYFTAPEKKGPYITGLANPHVRQAYDNVQIYLKNPTGEFFTREVANHNLDLLHSVYGWFRNVSGAKTYDDFLNQIKNHYLPPQDKLKEVIPTRQLVPSVKSKQEKVLSPTG